MKLLFDFLPILFFFIAYKFYGIYAATVIAMSASLLQIAFFWCKYRKVETMPMVTSVLILFCGTATLLLHNELFIKWKPTIIDWVFAVLFLGSQLLGKKPFIQSLMGDKVNLSQVIWRKLNLSWVIFFIVMGVVNLYVAYQFSTDIWVNFKLFGALGCTILFGILQSLYIAKRSQVLTQQAQEITEAD